jgi:glycosyltransferase involved in cell wall biosynthesis
MDSKNTPLVSVVMPSYNGSKFIHTALFSALEQKYTNMECIVIDDGSTDNTKEIVASIQKQDQRVKLVQNTTNQ